MGIQGKVILSQATPTTPPPASQITVFGWSFPFADFVLAIIALFALAAAVWTAHANIQSAKFSRENNLAQRRIAELNAISELNMQYTYVAFELKDMLFKRIEKLEQEQRAGNITPDQLQKEKDEARDEYFRRYWGLQYNQFKTWSNNFIPTDTYKFWLTWQKRRYDDNERDVFSNISYRDGYSRGQERIGGLSETVEFFNFMNTVFINGIDEAIALRKLRLSQRQRTLRDEMTQLQQQNEQER